MKKLIAISGFARSGKDTLATLVMGQHRFVRMAFADPLKEAAMVLFDLPREVVYSDDKTQWIEQWDMTLREILQKLGTEAMRNTFGQDFWIKRWSNEFDSLDAPGVVITDCRFENEAAAVRDRGGLVVHLVRPGAGLKGDAGRHASEAGLVRDPYDYVVMNDGTIADLALKVDGILAALK